MSSLAHNIVIAHQYYCPEHFISLYGHDRCRVEFLHIDPLYYVYKAIFVNGKRVRNILLALRSVVNFGKLLHRRKAIVILGLSPYNWLIFLCVSVFRNNRVIFFTSWPLWDKAVSCYGPAFIGPIWKSIIRKYCVAVACVNLKSYSYWTHYLPSFLVEHSVEIGKYLKKSDYAGSSRLLYIGRNTRYKNVSILQEAIDNISMVSLDICGDESFRHSRMGHSSRFLGMKDKRWIYENLRYYDALVLVSDASEPFGIVLLEAMAVGLPVIVTPTAGTATIFRNGPYKFMARSSSRVDIADAIKLFVESTQEERRLTGELLLNMAHTYDVVSAKEKWAAIFDRVYSKCA